MCFLVFGLILFSYVSVIERKQQGLVCGGSEREQASDTVTASYTLNILVPNFPLESETRTQEK